MPPALPIALTPPLVHAQRNGGHAAAMAEPAIRDIGIVQVRLDNGTPQTMTLAADPALEAGDRVKRVGGAVVRL